MNIARMDEHTKFRPTALGKELLARRADIEKQTKIRIIKVLLLEIKKEKDKFRKECPNLARFCKPSSIVEIRRCIKIIRGVK